MQFSIRQARQYAGLTQAETAHKLGICRGAYIRLEKDPSRATVGQINSISRITGIPVNEFFLENDSTKVE